MSRNAPTGDATPIVIASAPNGAYKQQTDHQALPLSLPQIVDTAVAVQAAGASMLHLHIREDDGRHSLDPNRYQKTVVAIQDQVDNKLLIQITSEAGGRYSAQEQISAIKQVKPEAVSVALREIIRCPEDKPTATDFFHWLAEQEILPQYILYSRDDVVQYHHLLGDNSLPNHPHSVLFVLGRYHAKQRSSMQDLTPFLDQWHDSQTTWMVCAFGAAEQQCLLHSIDEGGHARIGFENNLLQPDGSIAHSNEAQVASLRYVLSDHTRPIASAQQARQLLASQALKVE